MESRHFASFCAFCVVFNHGGAYQSAFSGVVTRHHTAPNAPSGCPAACSCDAAKVRRLLVKAVLQFIQSRQNLLFCVGNLFAGIVHPLRNLLARTIHFPPTIRRALHPHDRIGVSAATSAVSVKLLPQLRALLAQHCPALRASGPDRVPCARIPQRRLQTRPKAEYPPRSAARTAARPQWSPPAGGSPARESVQEIPSTARIAGRCAPETGTDGWSNPSISP